MKRPGILELVQQSSKDSVLTGRRGADLVPDDHPCFLGRPSTYGQQAPTSSHPELRLLISVGSRLSIPLVGRSTKAFAAAHKVVVNNGPERVGKADTETGHPLAMDAGRFMKGACRPSPDSLSLLIRLGGTLSGMAPEIPGFYAGPSLPPDPSEDGLIYHLSHSCVLSIELR